MLGPSWEPTFHFWEEFVKIVSVFLFAAEMKDEPVPPQPHPAHVKALGVTLPEDVDDPRFGSQALHEWHSPLAFDVNDPLRQRLGNGIIASYFLCPRGQPGFKLILRNLVIHTNDALHNRGILVTNLFAHEIGRAHV